MYQCNNRIPGYLLSTDLSELSKDFLRTLGTLSISKKLYELSKKGPQAGTPGNSTKQWIECEKVCETCVKHV